MKLLLLAGTGEARRIARALADLPLTAIASLAGATDAPKPLGIPTRHGGFGGADGFNAYLDGENITHVLDATHPFANAITNRTARICKTRNMPYAQVLRAAWVPQGGDDWTFFDNEEDIAGFIPDTATVFLGTGPGSLPRLGNLPPRKVICRRIDPPRNPFPFQGGNYLLGKPPFSIADEVALFRELRVDWLVVKNSGGDASRSKLDAARELGIKVALKNRPPMPDATRVETVDAALDWVRGQ